MVVLNFFLSVLALLVVHVDTAPSSFDSDITIGDIINLLNLGVITRINAFITVRLA
jgi:hypothetical protein